MRAISACFAASLSSIAAIAACFAASCSSRASRAASSSVFLAWKGGSLKRNKLLN